MSIEERLNNVEKSLKATNITSKDVLTLDEAVQFTGLSKSYMYKLTSARKIPHYCPTGKLLYFNRSELENWLQQNRITPIEEIKETASKYQARKRGTL